MFAALQRSSFSRLLLVKGCTYVLSIEHCLRNDALVVMRLKLCERCSALQGLVSRVLLSSLPWLASSVV